MKVYVENLPKYCEECPCCNECMDYGISCNLDDIKLSYCDYAKKRHINCPLQSLADYTKQVRKEVVQEIRNLVEKYFDFDTYICCGEDVHDDVVLTKSDFNKIIDKVLKEYQK